MIKPSAMAVRLASALMFCACDGDTNDETPATDAATQRTPDAASEPERDADAPPVTDADAAAGSGAEPYAKVVAVATSGSSGAYTFNVSIESADVDCTQYADFWEVLAENGTLIYRRILEHSHTDANGTSDPDAPGNTFTRSGGPVAASADQTVIVRAHISTNGYHGTAMRGSADSGFAAVPDLSEGFAAGVEDDPPQPTDCQF